MGYRSLYKSYIMARKGEIPMSEAMSQLNSFRPVPLLGTNEAELGICVFNGFNEYINKVHNSLARLCTVSMNTDAMVENAVSQVAISGISLSKKGLKNALKAKPANKNERAGVNMVNAVLYCRDKGYISEQGIHGLWRTITDGCHTGLHMQKTRYRASKLDVVKGNKLVYRADIPEYIQSDMQSLVRYLHTDRSSGILKAVIAHHYYRYVSPMEYGNGRTARMLMLMYLNASGYVGAYNYPIAYDIVNSLVGYHVSFEDSVRPVKYHGRELIDITPAVLYMLTMLDRCANRVYESYMRLSEDESRVAVWLSSARIITSNDCANLLRCDIGRARSILNSMHSRGILRKSRKGNMNVYSLLR